MTQEKERKLNNVRTGPAKHGGAALSSGGRGATRPMRLAFQIGLFFASVADCLGADGDQPPRGMGAHDAARAARLHLTAL